MGNGSLAYLILGSLSSHCSDTHSVSRFRRYRFTSFLSYELMSPHLGRNEQRSILSLPNFTY